jgi:hypothetical protein
MNSNSLKARQDKQKIIAAQFLAVEKLKIIQLTVSQKQYPIATYALGLPQWRNKAIIGKRSRY